MTDQSLYRKVALDRMSSPEQLDQLMVLARPRIWVALAALGAVLLAAVFWGVFGRVPYSVVGQGILVYPSGVLEVVSPASGQVKEILVERDQEVAEGDPIARLGQPELEAQLADAQRQIAALRAERGARANLDSERRSISNELLDVDDAFLRQKLDELNEQRTFFEEQLATQRELVEKGLVTKSTINDAKEKVFDVSSQIASTEQALEQNQLQRVTNRQQNQSEQLDQKQQLDDLEAQASQLEKRLEASATVTSSFAGEVTDILIGIGDVVGAGTPIVHLDDETGALTAVVYVAPGDGKKVQTGMEIQIVPSTVKREEHGFMRAKVREVSEFPSPPAAMQAYLQNESLVSELSQNGPPIAVWVDLVTDDSTSTGFAWSSGSGPGGSITPGTLCSGEVIVREVAPIELVIPTLRDTFGF